MCSTPGWDGDKQINAGLGVKDHLLKEINEDDASTMAGRMGKEDQPTERREA